MHPNHSFGLAFRTNHPVLAAVLRIVIWNVLLTALSFMTIDPLVGGQAKMLAFVLLTLMIPYGIYLEWYIFGRRKWIILAGIIWILVLEASVFVYIHSLPVASGAKEMMAEFQVVASRCVLKNEDLRGSFNKYRKGIPKAQSPICSKESNWRKLPSGWAFNPIEDADVSDGTFTFSAKSRGDEMIACTEVGCVSK